MRIKFNPTEEIKGEDLTAVAYEIDDCCQGIIIQFKDKNGVMFKWAAGFAAIADLDMKCSGVMDWKEADGDE